MGNHPMWRQRQREQKRREELQLRKSMSSNYSRRRVYSNQSAQSKGDQDSDGARVSASSRSATSVTSRSYRARGIPIPMVRPAVPMPRTDGGPNRPSRKNTIDSIVEHPRSSDASRVPPEVPRVERVARPRRGVPMVSRKRSQSTGQYERLIGLA